MTDADLVLRFARAVVKPGGKAMLLAAENRPLGGSAQWVPIEDAVARGGPFVVDPREGTIACDVDGPAGQPWADVVAAKARGLGCNVVRVGSGREGHEHLWLVGPAGWSSDDLRELAESCGAPKGQIRHKQATRPPLSPHRWGGYGALIEPAHAGDALRLLERNPRTVPLSDRTQVLVRRGDPQGEYTNRTRVSRTALTQAIVSGWVNAGEPFESLADQLGRPYNVGGAKYREQGERATDWLQRMWNQQRKFVKDNPLKIAAEAEKEELERVTRTADGPFWTGRAGTTDRGVYQALVAVCNGEAKGQKGRLGRAEAACSQRRLAELTGRSRKTVGRSLQRLHTNGFITETAVDDYGVPILRLHPRSALNAPTTTPSVGEQKINSGGVKGTFTPLATYAFQGRRGLPPAALDTLAVMPVDVWVKTSQVRQAHPGVPVLRTIRSHLEKLHSLGAVDHDLSRPQFWQRSAHANKILERFATRRGLGQRAEDLRARNKIERAAFAARFSDRAAPDDVYEASYARA